MIPLFVLLLSVESRAGSICGMHNSYILWVATSADIGTALKKFLTNFRVDLLTVKQIRVR